MPDIHAAAGDEIEVSVIQLGLPISITGKIMTKTEAGKWEVELAGDPPMRGKVDIAQYEWSQERGCWRKRADIKAAPVLTQHLGNTKETALALLQQRTLGS